MRRAVHRWRVTLRLGTTTGGGMATAEALAQTRRVHERLDGVVAHLHQALETLRSVNADVTEDKGRGAKADA